MTIEGIIFANQSAFDGALTGKLAQYKALAKDTGEVTKFISKGIPSRDDNKVLLSLNNEHIRALNWNPHLIENIDTTDSKWF